MAIGILREAEAGAGGGDCLVGPGVHVRDFGARAVG